MTRLHPPLITPIYLKQSQDMPRPEDAVYYLLASDNLYLCRNHANYHSCVPAPSWPTELVPHAASLVPNYPAIPKELLEQICGFFGRMSEEHSAEAIALLAWDRTDQVVRPIIPLQVSAVGTGAQGGSYPIGVKYRFPRDLPRHWDVFCDIHSHCELRAYASQTDMDDEDHFNGLHIVVGCLHQEPPEFHAEAVVDGTRFLFESDQLVAQYDQRAEFPVEWLDQVVISNYATFRDFDFDADVKQ